MRQEFRLHNYKLDFPDFSVFTTSPWLSPLFFVIYRAIIAVYTTIWTILGVVDRQEEGFKWFIYLTNWSYTFLNVHFILGTLLPFYFHYLYTPRNVVSCDANANEQPKANDQIILESACSSRDKRDASIQHPRMLIISCKASWVIYNIAANVGPLVTILYWSFDYNPGQYVDGSNINAHALNAALIILDVLICSVPFRVFHLIYPMVYGLIYTLFTVIYWAAGGTDGKGNPYIYAMMNYEENTGLAVLMACAFIFLALPLSQFLLYCLYRFRAWLVTTGFK